MSERIENLFDFLAPKCIRGNRFPLESQIKDMSFFILEKYPEVELWQYINKKWVKWSSYSLSGTSIYLTLIPTKKDFTYNDFASTIDIGTALKDYILEKPIIKVTTAFDAGAITLQDNDETLMEDFESDLTVLGGYETASIMKEYTSGQTLTATLTGSPSMGEATIYLKFLKK